MAITPEQAEQLPELPYNSTLVSRAEEIIDLRLREELHGQDEIFIPLSHLGIMNIGQAEAYALKRKYSVLGWRVSLYEWMGDYHLKFQPDSKYITPEDIRKAELLMERDPRETVSLTSQTFFLKRL